MRHPNKRVRKRRLRRPPAWLSGTAAAALGLVVLTTLAVTPVLAATSAMPSTSSTSTTGARATSVVRTDTGLVRGVRSARTERYLGIPYARPPVKDLRWRAPQPVQPWAGVRQATKSGPPCPQDPGSINPGTDREDCLYLDVTTPRRGARNHSGRGVPVMVWLHGGGLSSGAGAPYDPTRMVSQGNVVVVTVDFRLGIFGLFGHPGLAGSGTFTLADQQSALRWVRRNIAAFGGDEHNVTLFGQSGGAVGVCGQLTSPAAAGLFDKAVLMSGSCTMDWPRNGPAIGAPAGSFWTPVRKIAATGTTSATKLHCARASDAAELACLRGLGMRDLLTQNSSFFAAGTGTPLLPLDPGTAVREGLFHRVPVISGHTRDEARLLSGSDEFVGHPITADEYPVLLRQSFGDRAGAVLARYPLGDRIPGVAWASVDTDRMFVCTQLETSAALARRVPTYTYEFADENAPPIAPLPFDFPAGASHAADVMYLFDLAGVPIDANFQPIEYTARQRALAAAMIGYWTRFARTGNPNGGGAPHWQQVVSTGPYAPETPALTLAPQPVGIGAVDTAREHQCAFWHHERAGEE